MKIIQTDNFNRENISESVIAENVPDYWAGRIAELLNEKFSGPDSSIYIKVELDHYKPYKFTP